jgi:hypothetical protein
MHRLHALRLPRAGTGCCGTARVRDMHRLHALRLPRAGTLGARARPAGRAARASGERHAVRGTHGDCGPAAISGREGGIDQEGGIGHEGGSARRTVF